MRFDNPFHIAAVLLGVSAALCLAGLALSGFASEGLSLLMAVLVFGLFIWGLARGWRWFAYLAFFFSAIAGIGALSQVWSVNDVPSWIYVGILVASWLASALIFAGLWRSQIVESH